MFTFELLRRGTCGCYHFHHLELSPICQSNPFLLQRLIMPSYMPIIASDRGKAPLGKFFPGIATLGKSTTIHLKQNFPLKKKSSFRYLSEGRSKIPSPKNPRGFSIRQRNVSFFLGVFHRLTQPFGDFGPCLWLLELSIFIPWCTLPETGSWKVLLKLGHFYPEKASLNLNQPIDFQVLLSC